MSERPTPGVSTKQPSRRLLAHSNALLSPGSGERSWTRCSCTWPSCRDRWAESPPTPRRHHAVELGARRAPQDREPERRLERRPQLAREDRLALDRTEAPFNGSAAHDEC